PADEFLEITAKFLLRRVIESVSGNSRERLRFNFMDKLFGSAFCGNEIEPAPRTHSGREIENALRDRVAAAKIVKKPTVQPCGAQIVLYFGKIERHFLRRRTHHTSKSSKASTW